MKKRKKKIDIAPRRIVISVLAFGILIWTGIIAVYNYASEVEMYKSYRLINTAKAAEADAPTRRSVQFNPQNGYAHYHRGAYYKKAGKDSEALREFEKALKTTAHPASAWRILGDLHLENGRYMEAAKCYGKAHTFDPFPRINTSGSWFNYARALQGSGKAGYAVAAYRRSLRLSMPLSAAGPATGFLLAFIKARQAGISEYLYVLLMEPDTHKDLSNWALSFSQQGLNEFGAALFTKLEERDILKPGDFPLFSSFYLYMEEFERAREILDRAEKLNPENANIYLMRGKIAEKAGQKEEMRSYYKKFLELNPDAPQREILEKRIAE